MKILEDQYTWGWEKRTEIDTDIWEIYKTVGIERKNFLKGFKDSLSLTWYFTPFLKFHFHFFSLSNFYLSFILAKYIVSRNTFLNLLSKA